MRAASCFSGIGGAELALPEAEWLWCAEIEKFPSAVLASRFGHPNLGDITAPDFIERAAAFGPLDLLAGGPPCQAFSVAGLRKGMSDPRGQLSIRFLEIAHAIRPRNLLVENVPGWLSHEDNAFGCFLGGLVGADDALPNPAGGSWPRAGMVAGPRARAAWRVLDAQYAGLAQRRERVFLVADFGDGADPVEVLFERQSLSGNHPPRRQAGQGVTGTLSARTQGGGGLGTDFECEGGLQPVGFGGGNTSGPIDVAACLTAKGQRVDFEVETFLAEPAHTLRAEGFDASEDGTGRGTPVCVHADAICRTGEALTPSADAAGKVRLRDAGMGISEDVAFSLTTGQPHAIAFPERMSSTQYAAAEDLAPSLTALNPTAVAFSCKDYGADMQTDLSPTLRAMGHVNSHPNSGGQIAVALPTREVSPTITQNYGKQVDSSDTNEGPNVLAVAIQAGALRENPESGPDGAGFKEDVAYTLEARAEVQAVATQWAVRRLTVTECCRLQGYPDDWTMIEHGSRRTIDDDEAAYLTAKGAHVVRDNEGRWRTNAAADGPQYKALGNAWAVACVRPVVLRIMEGQP